jgi:hypothetical protein
LQHATPFVYGPFGNDAELTTIPANLEFERLIGAALWQSESDILFSFDSDFAGG